MVFCFREVIIAMSLHLKAFLKAHLKKDMTEYRWRPCFYLKSVIRFWTDLGLCPLSGVHLTIKPRNMWDMARFYSEYQSNEILQPLVAEISWSKHIVILTKCKETQQRQFYILATKKYGWTKDVLIHKIELKAYENFLLGQSNFDTTLTESSTQSSSEEGHRKRTWLNSGHAPFLFKSNIRALTDG